MKNGAIATNTDFFVVIMVEPINSKQTVPSMIM